MDWKIAIENKMYFMCMGICYSLKKLVSTISCILSYLPSEMPTENRLTNELK